MTYEDIFAVIQNLGLLQEPAFQQLTFVIEPIPCDNSGCALGLYDPNRGVIILPPQFLESALIHELGHRYGHYYYNDLSEAFAEKFRRHYLPGSVLAAVPAGCCADSA